MNLFLSKKLLSALKFASRAHEDQKRKDMSRTPYISHPAAVGLILQKAGFSEDVIIAGILHDVIEDTKFTFENIQEQFGETVAKLVQEVSEDTHLAHDARKENYLQNLANASTDAIAISAADLLANRVDMLTNFADGDEIWLRPPYNMDIEKKIERDMRRFDIIQSKSNIAFLSELENVLEETHKVLIKGLSDK